MRLLVARDNFVNLFAVMAAKRARAGLGEKGITLAADYEFSETEHVRPDFRPITFMEVRLEAAAGKTDTGASGSPAPAKVKAR